MPHPARLWSDAVTSELNRRHRWRDGSRTVEIAIRDRGGSGPAWLLHPALSTISSRREWQTFCEAIDGQQGDASRCPRLIRLDWPGFGESDRLRLACDAKLLARFLLDVRRDAFPLLRSLVDAPLRAVPVAVAFVVQPPPVGSVPTAQT